MIKNKKTTHSNTHASTKAYFPTRCIHAQLVTDINHAAPILKP